MRALPAQPKPRAPILTRLRRWLARQGSPNPPEVLTPVRRSGPPRYYLSLASRVKDEEPYLEEWINFHQMLGCEHFYLYDHESTDGTPSLLERYQRRGCVTRVPWSGDQKSAVGHALSTYGEHSRWMMFIDVDEFVFPTKSDSLREALAEYEDLPAVVLHWRMFGHSGHLVRPNGLVIENYTMRSAIPNPYASPSIARSLRREKSIVDPSRVRGIGIHKFPTDLGDVHYTVMRKALPDRDWRPSDDEPIVLNHYYGRSVEEFEHKRSRARDSGRLPDRVVKRTAIMKAIEQAPVECHKIQPLVPRLKYWMQQHGGQ